MDDLCEIEELEPLVMPSVQLDCDIRTCHMDG